MEKITRRNAIKTTAGAGLVLAASSCCKQATPKKECKGCNARIMKNDDFYAGGKFVPEKAMEAYYDMMRCFEYPIQDVLKTENLWTCDFLQNDFLKLGMAGIFWINKHGKYGEAGVKKYTGDFKDHDYGYLGHEIYLLPGQMLPEHSHIGGPEGCGPKMEAWHVRYGEVEFFGEYKFDGDEMLISDMPEEERPWGYGADWFKSQYVAKRTAQSGKVYVMDDPVSWHFQRAGRNGAIVSEYATYHNHVQFSKPGMEFANTGHKA